MSPLLYILLLPRPFTPIFKNNPLKILKPFLRLNLAHRAEGCSSGPRPWSWIAWIEIHLPYLPLKLLNSLCIIIFNFGILSAYLMG